VNLLVLAIYNAGLAVIMIIGWGATDIAIHLIAKSNERSVESLRILYTLFRVGASFFTAISLVVVLTNGLLNTL